MFRKYNHLTPGKNFGLRFNCRGADDKYPYLGNHNGLLMVNNLMKPLFTLLLTLSVVSGAVAQDPVFSQ
ncbi:MAG: hypothetical protein AAFN65_13440, partial [Bacteroidota bacterium]